MYNLYEFMCIHLSSSITTVYATYIRIPFEQQIYIYFSIKKMTIKNSFIIRLIQRPKAQRSASRCFNASCFNIWTTILTEHRRKGWKPIYSHCKCYATYTFCNLLTNKTGKRKFHERNERIERSQKHEKHQYFHVWE